MSPRTRYRHCIPWEVAPARVSTFTPTLVTARKFGEKWRVALWREVKGQGKEAGEKKGQGRVKTGGGQEKGRGAAPLCPPRGGSGALSGLDPSRSFSIRYHSRPEPEPAGESEPSVPGTPRFPPRTPSSPSRCLSALGRGRRRRPLPQSNNRRAGWAFP